MRNAGSAYLGDVIRKYPQCKKDVHAMFVSRYARECKLTEVSLYVCAKGCQKQKQKPSFHLNGIQHPMYFTPFLLPSFLPSFINTPKKSCYPSQSQQTVSTTESSYSNSVPPCHSRPTSRYLPMSPTPSPSPMTSHSTPATSHSPSMDCPTWSRCSAGEPSKPPKQPHTPPPSYSHTHP